jgi:hypothetical protein
MLLGTPVDANVDSQRIEGVRLIVSRVVVLVLVLVQLTLQIRIEISLDISFDDQCRAKAKVRRGRATPPASTCRSIGKHATFYQWKRPEKS